MSTSRREFVISTVMILAALSAPSPARAAGSLSGWGYNQYGQTNVPGGTLIAVSGGEVHSLAIRSDGTLAGWGYNNVGQIDVPLGTFSKLAAGFHHGVAIRTDGTLVGWGSNSDGQIDVPAGTFTAVAAGEVHSLAIRSDGTLAGWGNNISGQIDVPAGTFTAIAAGHAHSLALRSDGTLAGWGYNNLGQINVPPGTFTAVAAGWHHSLAIRNDGTLVGWGNSSNGLNSIPSGTFIAVVAGRYHSLAIRSDGTLVGWGYNALGQISVPSGNFTAIASGAYHGLAMRATPCLPPPPGLIGWWPGDGNANDIFDGHDGTVESGVAFSPGKVDDAFLFDGTVFGGGVSLGNIPALDFLPSSSFTIDAWVNFGETAAINDAQMIVSLNYSCSLTAQFLTAYSSPYGRVGFEVRDANGVSAGPLFSPPVLLNTWHHVAGVRKFTDTGATLTLYVDGAPVATAADPTTGPLALNTSDVIGRRNTCGSNNTFNGLIDEVQIFNRALDPSEINAIYNAGSAGKCKSCEALPPGVAVAWGNNSGGQCNVPSPRTGFTAVVGGGQHSLGLKCDGSIVAWGFGPFGQASAPSPNTGFVAVDTRTLHNLALKSDGSIVAWGFNNFGQSDLPSPNMDFVGVAAGHQHSLGLKADGSIVAWGDNQYGQIIVPAPNADFIGIAGGYFHSLGLKANGSIVAWGVNSDGQLNVPIPNTDFVAAAAGERHSLGLKGDGSIVAWGGNTYGQSNAPSPNTGFVAIVAGREHNLGLKGDGSIVAWGSNWQSQGNVPSPNTSFRVIAAGEIHSLAIRTTNCLELPDGTVCDDGDVCTSGDTCSSGYCVGDIYLANCCHTDPECNDFNLCTTDACVNNACTYTNVAVGTPCGSSLDDDCTDPDSCDFSGVCQPNNALDGMSCALGLGIGRCRFGLCNPARYEAARLPEGGLIDESEAVGGTVRPSDEKVLILGSVTKVGLKHAAVWECGTTGQDCTLTELPDGGAIASSANDVACNPAGTCAIVGSTGNPPQPAAWHRVGNDPWTAESVPLPIGKDEGELWSVTLINGGFAAAGSARMTSAIAANLNFSRSNVNRWAGPSGPWTASDLPDFEINDRGSAATSVTICPSGASAALCVEGALVLAGYAQNGARSVRLVLWRETGAGSGVFVMKEMPLPNGIRAASYDGSASIFVAGDSYVVGGNGVGPLYGANLNFSRSNVNAATAAPIDYDLYLPPLPGYNSSFGNQARKQETRDKEEQIGMSYDNGEDPLTSGVPTQWVVDYSGTVPAVLAVINFNDVIRGPVPGSTIINISDVGPIGSSGEDSALAGTMSEASSTAAVELHAVVLIPVSPLDVPENIIWNADPLSPERTTRSLRFRVAPPVTATGTFGQSAIKVSMIDLQNPVPPNLAQYPPPDFSTYESASCTAGGETNGCARWVGKPGTFIESQDNPGIGNYRAARLQCTPFYFDWVSETATSPIAVVGAEINPSSEYRVQSYAPSCKGLEDTCANVSTPVTMFTRRSGDVEAPYNPPATSTQPNAIDVTQLVNKFKNATGALVKAVSQLQPNLPELNADINALDIVAVVDAVKQLAYAYSGPCPCPSAVTCGGTPCATPGVCVSTYGAGSICVKTCNGGDNLGDPCINNTHCPGGSCSNGFCRDRCGRCN